MNEIESLEHFTSKWLEKETKKLESDILHQLQIEKVEIYESFIQSLQGVFDKVMQEQADGNSQLLSYVSYSLLNINFLSQKPLFTVEAFDENWFLFPSICEQSYEIDWFSKRLYTFYERAIKEQKKYVGKIMPTEAEKFVLLILQRMFKHYMSFLKDMMFKHPLNEMEELNVLKKENFTLTIGNYRGLFRILYEEESV